MTLHSLNQRKGRFVYGLAILMLVIAGFGPKIALARFTNQSDEPWPYPFYMPLVTNEGSVVSLVNDPSPDTADIRADPASPTRTVGMWYSTWYANKGNYFWIRNAGQDFTAQFVADVDADGRADAVTYRAATGEWRVARSTGKAFEGFVTWIAGHGVGSKRQFLADVTGDGAADAIVYFENAGSKGFDGAWYVAPAVPTQRKFASSKLWRDGHGSGSQSQLLADVNGDRRADAIVFFDRANTPRFQGAWYVALAQGDNTFGNPSMWLDGFGSGSKTQLMGDVSGDGRADAVAFFDVAGAPNFQGAWYVARALTASFEAGRSWVTSVGSGSSRQMLGDINGDGKTDALAYFQDSANWMAATSTGTALNKGNWWKLEHGKISKRPYASSWQGLGKTGASGGLDAVAFFPTLYGGVWAVLSGSSAYTQPAMFNTWEAWDIQYRPVLTDGTVMLYDSTNTAVIDQHLKQMATNKIDFLIFDLTNYIDTGGGYISRGAQAVCQRIAKRNTNTNNRPIQFAIAIGGIQFVKSDGSTNLTILDDEAKTVYDRFVQGCGSANYFHLDGKPLLINYSSYGQRRQWETSNVSKANAAKFTLKWAQGVVPEAEVGQSVLVPPATLYKDYFGWAYTNGSLDNADVMVVMPGWNNRLQPGVARNASGEANFYKTACWQRVLTRKPRIVVVNSFNEYAEETAVAPTDTSAIPAGERWSSNNLYWDLTKSYISTYRKP